MKRHEHELCGKKLSSYNIDRANFTNFLNFFDMYLHIEEILLKSNVATKFDEPVWKNELGETVENEMDAMGYKCTIDITHPHMCIVMDECGCNLSQEVDNNNGGELYLTGVKDKAYSCTTNRHCHFTVIPVSLLNGELLMCVVIISGKRHDMLVELGVDTTKLGSLTMLNDKESLSLDDNIELLEQNIGHGGVFPTVPTCVYNGVRVPGYVAFTESGGITGTILTNIFRRLDDLKLFNAERDAGITPFVLLDGHGSRFEVEFLEYINDNEHLWNVCLGVPYGTALWQVADSTQQNGRFKMLLNKKKRELFRSRIDSCQQDMYLGRTDIIPLINECWHQAYGDKNSNRRAIAERGWYPYNRNLLLHPIIRASMTESMIDDEKK